MTYFDSCGVENIPKTIRNFISNKNSKAIVYRIQVNDSILSEYFCIGFIDFMLKSKSLLNYSNLFFPSEYENNDPVILK